MSEIHLRKYGVSFTINFELFEVSGADFRVDAPFAAGDLKIMKDEGAETNTVNLPTDEGTGYSLVITATEAEAARIVIYLVDQTATKVWIDRKIIIETYGHASAQHAFDFDDAAGGLPVGYLGSHGFGIYLDTNAANTNTVDRVDGIFSNPVSTPAAARTLADSIGVNKYYILGNSDVTLGAIHEDWEFIGYGSNIANVINLGSQDVDRSIFINICIEGTQGGTERIDAKGCALRDPGAGDTTLHIHAIDCGIVDRIQVDTSNDNVFENWHSLVAGTGPPIIQATGASGTISMRHGSGGIEFESLSASHNVSVETDGQVIFASNCNVNATIALRGNGTLTDNTSGMNNLSRDAFLNGSYIADINWDELVTGHTINNSTGKILKGIAEGWVADEGSVNDGSATTTTFISDLTNATTSFFSDATVVFITGALKGQSRIVYAYNGTTKAFTFDEPFTSAPANTDSFIILAQHTHTITDIAESSGSCCISKNAAFNNFEFPMVLTSDHYTAATGKTVTCQRSIDGGSFVNATGVLAEVGSGVYQIDLTAADTNGDTITYKFSAADCDDTIITITTRS